MNENVSLKPGEARCDAESYQDILDRDSKEAPACFREQNAPYLGSDPIPVEAYISQEFFDKEVEKLWPYVWQMACREEHIPSVGDYHVYNIVNKSVLVVRTGKDEIKAYYNACLHRGRKLATQDGCTERFRCPFHGFTWNLDGTFFENPTGWDFPHLKAEEMKLPELKVGTWGGFVFVNFDKDCEPLSKFLGVLPEHFKNWHYEDRYTHVHVAKVIKCNWKATAEAFTESFHTIDTHPQIMPFLACANSQYDLFGENVGRQISANAVPSPHVYDKNYTEQEILNSMTGMSGRNANAAGLEVPEGATARAFMAEASRQMSSMEDGLDYSTYSDAEMLDALLYHVFPNFCPWAGMGSNITYRWRPNGMDVDSCIMEVMMLKVRPKDGPQPEPVPVHWLSEDEKWTDAEELTGIADVFEQDMANLPYVQEGMKTSGIGVINLGNYQELPVRQRHVTLQKYLNK
jgi:phenylpropionate dioxygenase-like ring-hydroxylating dioxygenase large terminal subunit